VSGLNLGRIYCWQGSGRW